MFEVQSAIRPDSPLSGAAAVIRLGSNGDGKFREGADGVDQNEESVRSSIPRSDMTTRNGDDCFARTRLHTS